MLICIPQVLSGHDAGRILDELSTGQFVDGKLSAGEMARGVKNNLEYRRPENKVTEIDQIVGRGLLGNRTFQEFAIPKQFAPPIFSRYDVGMEYGLHVDTAILGQNAPQRSDLSVTVFLSDPESYDGGELTVETPFGEQQVKLPPGDAVLYSSTSLHRVAPVTRGTRFVALTWVQSYIRDEAIRTVLYDITLASRKLDEPPEGTEEAHRFEIKNRLYKAYSNLMRHESDL